MRCSACDISLTDYEATRKSVENYSYYDLCNNCFRTIKDQVTCLDRPDLRGEDDLDVPDVDDLDTI